MRMEEVCGLIDRSIADLSQWLEVANDVSSDFISANFAQFITTKLCPD